jgi:hypothetical protein
VTIIQEVSEALLKSFVAKYRRFQYIDREHVLRHHQTVSATQMMVQWKDQVYFGDE